MELATLRAVSAEVLRQVADIIDNPTPEVPVVHDTPKIVMERPSTTAKISAPVVTAEEPRPKSVPVGKARRNVDCARCGKSFRLEKGQPWNTKYCSTDCRREAKAARKRGDVVAKTPVKEDTKESEQVIRLAPTREDFRWAVIEKFQNPALCSYGPNKSSRDWSPSGKTVTELQPDLSLCNSCPALVECAKSVMDNRETGIWGGGLWSAGRLRVWRCKECGEMVQGDIDVCPNCKHPYVGWRVRATRAAQEGEVLKPRTLIPWKAPSSVG